MKKVLFYLIPLFVLSACNDDDILNDVAPETNDVTVSDPNIVGLLTMLDNCNSVDVTMSPFGADEANRSNDIHNVHYFDGNCNVDKQSYQQAYENGHFFIVSTDNVNALNDILDRTSSVEISDKESFSEIAISEVMTDSVSDDVQSRCANAVEIMCDTIATDECVVSVPESAFYQLFNKNMEMVVAIPFDDLASHQTLEAVLDAIYTYQNAPILSRATDGVQLASDPILYTWTYKYKYYSNGKKFYENSQTISASYIITGCYSYDRNRDYYMLQQEVMMYNAGLDTFKKTIKDFYKGRDYYVYAGFSRGAYLKAVLGASSDSKLGKADNNKYHLIQTSPATSQNSTTVTTGINYSISGNIGITASKSPGVSGGVSGGVTFVDTRTTTIPDVSVKNVCGTGDDGKFNDVRYTEWQFNIAEPYSHSDYFEKSHCRWTVDDVANIGKTTATYIASHIWAVDNPKKDFNPIVGIGVTGRTGYSAGCQTWYGHWYTTKSTSSVRNWVTIRLQTPYRD